MCNWTQCLFAHAWAFLLLPSSSIHFTDINYDSREQSLETTRAFKLLFDANRQIVYWSRYSTFFPSISSRNKYAASETDFIFSKVYTYKIYRHSGSAYSKRRDAVNLAIFRVRLACNPGIVPFKYRTRKNACIRRSFFNWSEYRYKTSSAVIRAQFENRIGNSLFRNSLSWQRHFCSSKVTHYRSLVIQKVFKFPRFRERKKSTTV